jgi:hypothetical protein
MNINDSDRILGLVRLKHISGLRLLIGDCYGT